MMTEKPIYNRPGPRPLPLHLWMAATALLSSRAAFESLSAQSPNSEQPSPGQTGNQTADFGALIAALLKHGNDARDAIDQDAHERLDAFMRGIEAYRAHAYRRALPDPPVIWSDGTTRLLDFGAPRQPAADRAPLDVVFIPSLINRSYILDLAPGRSLMRWLAQAGGAQAQIRPLLLDWGAPGPTERSFDLTDYVTHRIEPALQHVAQQSGRPPVLAGYCMGGLLALAAAVRKPALCQGLALLATPWDFHAGSSDQPRLLGQLWSHAEPLFQAFGEVPVDVLQCLFFAQDPLLAVRKFASFAEMPSDGAKAAAFVALEDWINDGVPLAGKVAQECLAGWYGENRPHRGTWQVGGEPVLPERIQVPTLVACPQQDRIVPQASAMALADHIGHALVLSPPLGHVGMVIGGRAKNAFWKPFAAWLRGLI